MGRDDLDGDVRLRTSARASLARLEAEVDSQAAWLEFRDRLTDDPYLEVKRVAPRPLVRRYVAVAVLLLLGAGAAAALIRHDGDSRSATVVPNPTNPGVEQGTTHGSLPSDTSAAGPATSTIDVSSQAPAELVALFGRTWVITRADGQPRAFAAYFEMSSGKASGHDGCNFFDSTIQLETIADGASSMRVTSGSSTSAPCVPPYNEGWSAPSGRYLVDGDSLTIKADDGTTLDAVDLDSLPLVRSANEIIGQWRVPDGPDIEFTVDGTIRLPCATIGTWTASDSIHTTIDQAEAATNCPIAELRSLSWTYDDLLAGSPTIRRLADGSLLIGSSQLGQLIRPTTPPLKPTSSAGELMRPFVDPTVCAPLSATGDGDTTGSTFDLHLFAWPTTASSFPIQIIGDPNGDRQHRSHSCSDTQTTQISANVRPSRSTIGMSHSMYD